jgi:hypothetical protein
MQGMKVKSTYKVTKWHGRKRGYGKYEDRIFRVIVRIRALVSVHANYFKVSGLIFDSLTPLYDISDM